MLRPTAFAALASLALATASFTSQAGTHTFSNNAAFPISSIGRSSLINANGITGNVTSVTVTLYGLSSSSPHGLGIAVIGPGGVVAQTNSVVLMYGTGGTSVENVTLEFAADGATLPQITAVSSGRYQPSSYTQGGYPLDLSIFNGDPAKVTGDWQLGFSSDAVGNAAGGWSITITDDAPTTTCASEGYKGAQLTWCKNICESDLSGKVLDTWIHRWIERYRDLPYCARETPPPQPTIR